jgi:hypothetical protein
VGGWQIFSISQFVLWYASLYCRWFSQSCICFLGRGTTRSCSWPGYNPELGERNARAVGERCGGSTTLFRPISRKPDYNLVDFVGQQQLHWISCGVPVLSLDRGHLGRADRYDPPCHPTTAAVHVPYGTR